MIRDPLTHEAVLLGSTRSARPNEFRVGPQERCPFCAGNEDLTPPELARIDGEGCWSARAFRNLYPAIEPPHGDHEVIVDSPHHDREITIDGARLWRERYREALRRAPQHVPVLFKNRGAYAGATIFHPHTQLIVVPQRPPRWIAMREGEACALCREHERARANGLVAFESDDAIAFVREGSRFALALSIIPKRCAPSILDDETSWNAAVAALARAVESLLRSMGETTAFNVLVYSDPHDDAYHWHVEVIPRLSTLAGFELSTGAFIRGLAAQESAQGWRRMLGASDGPL